jgi:hypothetical protein
VRRIDADEVLNASNPLLGPAIDCPALPDPDVYSNRKENVYVYEQGSAAAQLFLAVTDGVTGDISVQRL